jgi:hypothetical protein
MSIYFSPIFTFISELEMGIDLMMENPLGVPSAHLKVEWFGFESTDNKSNPIFELEPSQSAQLIGIP